VGETEGVIKFNLTFADEQLEDIDVTSLSRWRTILKDRGLIGQEPDRYDGYGFGNISMRCEQGFIISGTQTGGLDGVTLDDYALCEHWDLSLNAITARGRVKPSSESLSHAAVYDVHVDVNWALHAHSPDLWQNAESLGIVTTDRSVAYGTPEMALEVRRHIENMPLPGIFSMGGHEDGIFTFAESLEEAGQLMMEELSRARALKNGEF